MAVDLHLHSTASDGTLSPTAIMARASEHHLTAISLTDHDTVAGVREILAINPQPDVEFIPGVELSSEHLGKDVHILGYFIDPNNTRLLSTMSALRQARVDRAREIMDRLAALGIIIEFAAVKDLARGEAIGRPHIAQALVKHGIVKTIGEAFSEYLGRGRPAYVTKFVLPVLDVLELVRQAGGVTSLAHPAVSGIDEPTIAFLQSEGLDALEVWHSDHSETQIDELKTVCGRLGLLATGGSDCHGLAKSRGLVLGSLDIPDELVDPLRRRAAAVI
jgi:3',5'-nucleoside bisphosphate phosphatase